MDRIEAPEIAGSLSPKFKQYPLFYIKIQKNARGIAQVSWIFSTGQETLH